MHEIPIKFAGTTALALASGGASIVNENTLVPLGIFITVSVFLVVTAWKLSSAVTRASDKLDHMDKRLQAVEARCSTNQCGTN